MKKIQTVTTKKGGEGGGEEDNPIQDDGEDNNEDSTVHKIEEEGGPEEDNAPGEEDEATVGTVDKEEEDELRVDRFIYMTKRARPDLQVAVTFLCKQVKCPNIDDWKK